MKFSRSLMGILLLLLLSPATVWAHDMDRDFEFAQNLLRLGFDDLAVECAKHTIKGKTIFGTRASGGRSSIDKGNARFLLINVEQWRADAANRKGKEDKYKAHMKKYSQMLKAFQKAYPNHPQSLTASLNLILAKRKQAHNDLIKARVEPDKNKKKRRITDGTKLYEESISEFSKLIKKYQAALDQAASSKLKKMLANFKGQSFEKPVLDDAHEELQGTDSGYQQLRYRRGMADYLRGETCLSYARWLERLKITRGNRMEAGQILRIASTAFQMIDNEFSGYYYLRGKSGLGLGEVYLRRAQLPTNPRKKFLGLARNRFDEFTLFRYPLSKDPAQRAADEKVIKEIRFGAYEGLCRTFIQLKEFKNAVYVIDKRMMKTHSYSEVLEMNSGRLALMAKTEALSIKDPPEPHRAMEEVLRIVEWAKKNEKPLKNRTYGIIALRAAIRLCDIREQLGAIKFGPEVSLLIAHGFYETGNYKWAIYSYKDVLSSKDVRDEETIAGALKGMGHCYYNTQRYEEASMTYYGVFERFPDRREGIKLAKQALGILTKQFGKEDEAVQELKKLITSKIGGGSAFYAQAYDLEQKASEFAEDKKKGQAVSKYKEAIESYKKVEKLDKATGQPSRYYAISQSKVANCMFQVYLINGQITYRNQAKEWLEKNVIPQFAGRNSRAWSAALIYLAKIYRDMDNHKKVLTVLKPFDNKLQRSNYAGAAKNMVIGSAIALGRSDIADNEFKKLKDNPATTKPQLVNSAMQLTSTYNRFVSREREKIKNGYRAWTFLYNKSNLVNLVSAKSLSLSLVQKNKGGKPRFMTAQNRAAEYAKVVYDYYSKKGIKFSMLYYLADIMLKGKRYSWAAKAYRDAIKLGPPAPKDKNDKGAKAANAQYNFFCKQYLAKCLLRSGGSGAAKEALAIYDKLAEDPSQQRNIFAMYRVLEGRAEAAVKVADSGRQEDKAAALKRLHKFRSMVGNLNPQYYAILKEIDEAPTSRIRYWEVTLQVFKFLIETQRGKEAYQRLNSLIKQGADFGTPELKNQFRDIYKRLKRVQGG